MARASSSPDTALPETCPLKAAPAQGLLYPQCSGWALIRFPGELQLDLEGRWTQACTLYVQTSHVAPVAGPGGSHS